MYNKLDIEQFGRILILSGDLDPVYTALLSSIADSDHRKRWMVAYWCFYHAGVACYLSEFEREEFWDQMLVAAHNALPLTHIGGRWPRGKERRHFRGELAVSSIAQLMARYTKPESFFNYVSPPTSGGMFKDVASRVMEHRGFGPWMAFKVGDMIERVAGIPIDFDNSAVMMFDDPKKAAWMLWEQRGASTYPAGTRFKEAAVLNAVVDNLISEFSAYTPTPATARAINIQEVETILCKWKSHQGGHYPLNNDINELRHGIAPWSAVCETAKVFEGNL